MVKDRNTLVLYTTAVCNLNCTYCFIDKNKALKKIDNILDESFKGDYYFNFTKKMFPDKNQLKEIQIWGGEPSLKYDRAYYTIEKILDYYPKLTNFMTSTNFTTNNWFDQFYGLLNILNKFKDRTFNFYLQLSIDGPTNINDRQRGKGVTKLFTEHFMKLIDTIEDNIPNNVNIIIAPKPTLSSETIKVLQSRESIINYYRFFELYHELYYSKIQNKKQINMKLAIPNTVFPSPHTKEDGILFANLCRISRELNNDIRKGIKIFKFYTDVIPYHKMTMPIGEVKYTSCKGNCGSGYNMIGLLPYNTISSCFSGFTELLAEYKKLCIESSDEHSIDFKFFLNNSNSMIFNLKDYNNYENIMEEFYCNGSTCIATNIVGLIRTLAISGQIDKKYQDEKNALEAAVWMKSYIPYCVRDNQKTTGSFILPPVGLYKLLLNGAREYIENG